MVDEAMAGSGGLWAGLEACNVPEREALQVGTAYAVHGDCIGTHLLKTMPKLQAFVSSTRAS